jgi:MFS family permease
MQKSLEPVDDGERIHWLSTCAAIASISVVGIAIGLGMPLLSLILEQRGFSATLIGLNTAIAGIASIAAAPFATPLAMRFGVVPVMLAMIVAGAASFVGFYFAMEYWMWFPLRAILHFALTVLFILSEFWISTSAPPHRRGLVLGIYATSLSLGFAFGPLIFAQVGSAGFEAFAIAFALVIAAAIPVSLAWRESPRLTRSEGRSGGFWRYIWAVPTATMAVLVFGAVETGGFALFPVYGGRIGYSEADAALLLTMIGLGNVVLQVPIGMLSDHVRDRRLLLLICALTGLVGSLSIPLLAHNWQAMAAVLFIWGGVVAALYTVGLAHLGSRLSGHELAQANAAFVFCYGIGMVAGPQAVGVGIDLFGPEGFGRTLALFFGAFVLFAATRILLRRRRP